MNKKLHILTCICILTLLHSYKVESAAQAPEKQRENRVVALKRKNKINELYTEIRKIEKEIAASRKEANVLYQQTLQPASSDLMEGEHFGYLTDDRLLLEEQLDILRRRLNLLEAQEKPAENKEKEEKPKEIKQGTPARIKKSA